MEKPEPQPSEGIRERFPVMYESLRQIAGRMMRDQQARSLAPTELVAEAFVKLSSEEDRRVRDDRSMLGAKPDAAFKACFGAACRDVLVDRVRKRVALKRGGGQADAELHSQIMMPDQGEVDAAAVGELLGEMKELDEQLAQLVEARVFGDLSVPECAELLGVSPRTVDRRWAFAVKWLKERLGDES